ncbi:unnamed protein product [Mytilus edulis]|uniref:Ig-like domain-containing protein n=1 Tax=Mytilus edulis TaxID=6550 RepID=A0A8S3S183_MYTED|nr:unnamed protein product [Mytilus edulis]
MQTAFVGLSFEIQCSIHSTPMYTYVYWTRSNNATNTVLIPGTVGYEGMTASNPNLIIPKVDILMSGEYRCLAINEVGTGQSLPTYLTGTTASSILSTSYQEDETLGHERSTTKTQFSNIETKSTNGMTTAEIYVTEAEGADKSENSSNMYTDNESGNNTGKGMHYIEETGYFSKNVKHLLIADKRNTTCFTMSKWLA